MVRLAPCPTLVVKGDHMERHWPPRRLLVPTNGSASSRHAAEVAFLLATEEDEEVFLLSIVQRRQFYYGLGTAAGEVEHEARDQIVKELVEFGKAQGARARGAVEMDVDVDTGILEVARREGTDLILMGTDVRPGSDRLFLGPRVEHILKNAPCPVVIINAS
jgi:nucleotide-binding universal stress UspA family protein